MKLRVAARFARRELRGGLRGFAVFLTCLALGVAAIAAVGTVRAAIDAGLSDQGAVILGGDAEMEFDYRHATEAERQWMAEHAIAISELVDFRSMVAVERAAGPEHALTQVKGVDAAYPLVGSVGLDPPMPLDQALEGGDGFPGAVMARVLVERLGLTVGDTFALGTQSFRLSAVLDVEPDLSSAGFSLGPRTIVRTEDLAGAGLMGPGTIYETKYRLMLPAGADLSALEAEADRLFQGDGMRWRDSRNAAPSVREFIDRLGSFLVLVGLAGLAVGGVGVSASVRAYLAGKTGVIATLKTLGADRGTIFAIYLIQVGALALAGIVGGLVLGALLPLALAPMISGSLPVPVDLGIRAAPLAEAALYGVLTALVFALWPLARTEDVRAAALFRDAVGGGPRLPRRRYMVLIAGLAALLVAAATLLSGVTDLALWTAGGVLASLAVLALAAQGLRRLARALAGRAFVKGRPTLRLALAAIGGRAEEAGSVVLSLGLGLAVLAAMGQIDANLRNAISTELPKEAPSYFFVDIQPDQLGGFMDRLKGDPQVHRVETAPMLRGIITRINDRPAREVAGDHWVVRGDRGITYAPEPPPGTDLTAGQWWPADYDGPPQISFAAEEAAELGLKLGDRLTVNVLGRDITAEITSFRKVDFSSAGIGFVLSMNPAALAGAPHTHIATVYADPEAEAAILRDLAGAYPNITAIRIRDAIDNVTRLLSSVAQASAWGAGVTLLTGFIVLIGAAAAAERSRIYEAAVLKTLGASRRRILASFALRSALMGLAAAAVALVAGIAAGWGVTRFVMQTGYSVDWLSALAILTGGVLATLIAGMAFASRPLAASPARVLRSLE